MEYNDWKFKILFIIVVSALFILGLLLNNKLSIKIKNLFLSKTNKLVDSAIDKVDLLNLKEGELKNKKIEIIKSIAKMKANEMRNEENIKELEIKIQEYAELAKKYKTEENKDKCINILTQLHIKQHELENLVKINTELKSFVLNAENQLQIFKNNIVAIQSKISIVENKKSNAEALSMLSGLNEKDDNIDKLLDSANIEYDTNVLASDMVLKENTIDLDISKINLDKAYDNL